MNVWNLTGEEDLEQRDREMHRLGVESSDIGEESFSSLGLGELIERENWRSELPNFVQPPSQIGLNQWTYSTRRGPIPDVSTPTGWFPLGFTRVLFSSQDSLAFRGAKPIASISVPTTIKPTNKDWK